MPSRTPAAPPASTAPPSAASRRPRTASLSSRADTRVPCPPSPQTRSPEFSEPASERLMRAVPTSCAPPPYLSPRLPARDERLGSNGDPLPLRGRGDREGALSLTGG